MLTIWPMASGSPRMALSFSSHSAMNLASFPRTGVADPQVLGMDFWMRSTTEEPS